MKNVSHDWFDIQFFAICSLPLCNCTTRLKASLQLCAESLRRLYSDYSVPQASNLFCLPCCYISPQWCQAGLRSAITLKNNGVKGQSEPLSQRDHAISLRRQAPALSSALTYWLKYLLAVPLLTCNLLLAAAESEPDDKSLLGRSMFYGLDVLTVKLCLSVPSALRLNVKQPGMEGSLWWRVVSGAYQLTEPWTLVSPAGKSRLQLVQGHQQVREVNTITGQTW